MVLSPPHLRLMLGNAMLWGLGDVGAQAITHYSISNRRVKESEGKDEESISFRKFKIDWVRVYATSAAFGGCACIGPAAYYRFKFIDMYRYGLHPSRPKYISTVLEGLFGTLNIAIFFPMMGLFGALSRATFPLEHVWHGANWSVEQAKEDLKRGFAPALVLGGAMVPAKLIMISRFVPAPYQLHCASLLGLVGSCALSWIELQQQRDDAAAGPEDGRSNSACTKSDYRVVWNTSSIRP